MSFFSFLFILALADFSFSSFVCKGCQVAKKKCAMTEVGSKEGEKKTASKSKKRAREDESLDEVVEVAEVKGPRTARARRQTAKEWEEGQEWKRSMMGLMMSLSQKMSGMERRLMAVEAGMNRMGPTLDAAWGALQALITQEQEQEQEQGPEPSVEDDGDEEEETEEMLREKGAESGNPEDQEGSGNGGDVVMG